MEIIFYTSLFIIFWAMIGYPLSLILLGKLVKRENKLMLNYEPEVTIMVVSHNEEKVINQKLTNILEINYPRKKIKVIITSDNSTDDTNSIVKEFIKSNNLQSTFRLFEVAQRKGKTNAQNEAQKMVDTEILVMTDSNSVFDKNAVKELVSYFADDSVSYVCGRLEYTNSRTSTTADTESTYWNFDLKMRLTESRIQTITAGNGAIYAVRNSRYFDFDPIESHDSSMPLYYALKKQKALFNPKAIAYEKAGAVIKDEFKRKVRMNRTLLRSIMPNLSILNVFEYRWFTYFYLGHRTSRYLLGISHIMLLISNILLASRGLWYQLLLSGQIVFFILPPLFKSLKVSNSLINFAYYYMMTLLAQLLAIFKQLAGQSQAFWEKAESTR